MTTQTYLQADIEYGASILNKLGICWHDDAWELGSPCERCGEVR